MELKQEDILALDMGETIEFESLTHKQSTDIRGQLLPYQGSGQPYSWRLSHEETQRKDNPRFYDLIIRKVAWGLTDEQRELLTPYIDELREAFRGGSRRVFEVFQSREFRAAFGEMQPSEALDRWESETY